MNPEFLRDRPALPARDPNGHKGTFGTVLVIGGHDGSRHGGRTMLGAPGFAALGALRVGAGLAVLAVPETLLAATLAAATGATGVALPLDREGLLDASGSASRIDSVAAGAHCLILGPGFGGGVPEEQVVMRLVSRDGTPLVIDADALNALARVEGFAQDIRAPAILTPHPGEFARLAGALGLDADPIDPAARPIAAASLARRLGSVVVLKGVGTVVSDGLRAWTNDTGNAALATGGSGDVLSGIIGGLVAQFARPPHPTLSLFDCARLGTRLHGLAADRWAARHGRAGLVPTDLLAELPDILREERGEPVAP